MQGELQISEKEEKCLKCKKKGIGYYQIGEKYICDECSFKKIEHTILKKWNKER